VSEWFHLCLLLLLVPGLATAATLRDPTRPPDSLSVAGDVVEPGPSRWRLQGMFYRDGSRSALVNGRRVGVGDRVDGARVVSVDDRAVVLQRDGDRFELTPADPRVKRPATVSAHEGSVQR
jgi:hypothetical protein